jgi:SpoVK/Ycf46/Vps4 family AAA+-type ATPase
MKIVLDFDDTIFNTHQMVRKFIEVFEKIGFTEKEFHVAFRKCLEKLGKFDLEVFINLIFNSHESNYLNTVTRFSNKKEIEEKIKEILLETNNFIYPDLFDFVGDFDKKDLILLSFGEINFQRTKIENSKIILFFSEIIITLKDKVEDLKLICEKYNKDEIFFIDDKAEQIDKIKEELPQIITLKMERPQGEHINTKSKLADYIVKDLDEAKDIILKI